ncbi:glycoprotein 3-alpha-L-fucosyltransferase A-like [Sipha flava]|uniref:Fucosyltransferase n=1 Tax=Sipha flava TaxID=143950 RepID=A0A8B8GQ52_9HEMI|nr:glycoprotein 3-alpha-L-fucosyltransferase A-like [Sipha flava]
MFKIKYPCMRNCSQKFIITIVLIILLVSIYVYVFKSEKVSERKTCAPSSEKTSTYNKFTNSRLVWPDELPNGDRIKEQLYYVPAGYKYEMSRIKRILIHTGIGDVWEIPLLDQGEFIGCPVSQCWLTVNLSYGPEVDAVIFRHHYTRPTFNRPPNQIWIMHHTEAPYLTSIMTDSNVFNWTSDYRRDSDIPNPYGYFVEYKPPLPRIERNYAEGKTKKVAWLVSNCNPHSNRTLYANELANYISVDIYGYCGVLKCPRDKDNSCLKMFRKYYKFYLAFENAHCRHYITEKLFRNALSHDMLPIVMGPSRSDYELVAPKNSFIHVDDFESPKLLAEYLNKLDEDDELYNEYFRWKGTGTVISETRYYCRLCAMLHDEKRSPKYYEDINKWWNGSGVCIR